MQYTDTQLKQALAKMLPPKKVKWRVDSYRHGMAIHEVENLWWICPSDSRDTIREVLDTELLHLCWLVEQYLSEKQTREYVEWLAIDTSEYGVGNIHRRTFHATWQQRVIALAKVKGVEIV